MIYNNSKEFTTNSKTNELMNSSFSGISNDVRKMVMNNSLNVSDNAWSTDRITLSSEEYLYYINLFNLNDKFDNHFIDNKTASSFLQNSGLSIAVLHSIWEYSDIENKGYLTLEDFFICCRLVAHAQNGNSLSSEIINIRPPCLPSFDIIRHKSFSDISNLDGNVEWKISGREKENYKRIFKTLDINNEEKIEGTVIREYYLNTSNLSICELMQIWSISDLDNDGFLNFEQFCIMNKMVEMRKEKEINIPLTIPPELLKSIKTEKEVMLDDNITFNKMENNKDKRDSFKMSFGDLLIAQNENRGGEGGRGGGNNENEKLDAEFDFFEFKKEDNISHMDVDDDEEEEEVFSESSNNGNDNISGDNRREFFTKGAANGYGRIDQGHVNDIDYSADIINNANDVDDNADANNQKKIKRKSEKHGKRFIQTLEEEPSEGEEDTERKKYAQKKKSKEERDVSNKRDEKEKRKSRRNQVGERQKEANGDEREQGRKGEGRRSTPSDRGKYKNKKKRKEGIDGKYNEEEEEEEKEEEQQQHQKQQHQQHQQQVHNNKTRSGNMNESKDNQKENEKRMKKKMIQSEKYFTKLIDFNYSDLKNYNIESKDVYKIEEINRKLEEDIKKKKENIEKKKKQMKCLAYVYENELKRYQCLKEERRNLEFLNICLYKDIKHKKENIRNIKKEIKELIDDINKINIENININKEYINKEKEIKTTDYKRKSLNILIDKEKNDLKKDERNLIILKNMIDYLRKQKCRAIKLQENLKNRYDVTNSDHQMLIKNILHQQNYLNKITNKRLNIQKIKNQNIVLFNSLSNQSVLLDLQNAHPHLKMGAQNDRANYSANYGESNSGSHSGNDDATMQNNAMLCNFPSVHRRYFTDKKGIPNDQNNEMKNTKKNLEIFEHIKNGDSVDIFSSLDEMESMRDDDEEEQNENDSEDLADLTSKENILQSVDNSN
ncbi:formin 2, putative [Plasmodium malariae]|uniref:Formin 2, putative n=1 Tax=Plasmodium malariae TaxID=5858 RepID=A0A1A8X7A9_PLAMA|nr:formin 2, putative [Plasmodium malariae]